MLRKIIERIQQYRKERADEEAYQDYLWSEFKTGTHSDKAKRDRFRAYFPALGYQVNELETFRRSYGRRASHIS